MKKESEAHEASSLLFHRDEVPNVMVMDGAKAQIEGQFRSKLRDAGCHIKQTEPHTQSYNMGEGGVCELKIWVERQILLSGCPKKFVDDCIIREALLITKARQAHKYPIPPWEMIHLPMGDNALYVPPYTVYTAVCNKSLTATYQYKISNPSNKELVNNN
jgi:hypothetical protein